MVLVEYNRFCCAESKGGAMSWYDYPLGPIAAGLSSVWGRLFYLFCATAVGFCLFQFSGDADFGWSWDALLSLLWLVPFAFFGFCFACLYALWSVDFLGITMLVAFIIAVIFYFNTECYAPEAWLSLSLITGFQLYRSFHPFNPADFVVVRFILGLLLIFSCYAIFRFGHDIMHFLKKPSADDSNKAEDAFL
jgi:hypothetical protein